MKNCKSSYPLVTVIFEESSVYSNFDSENESTKMANNSLVSARKLRMGGKIGQGLQQDLHRENFYVEKNAKFSAHLIQIRAPLSEKNILYIPRGVL